MKSMEDTMIQAANEALEKLSAAERANPQLVREAMLQTCHDLFEFENSVKPRGEKWPIPKVLPPGMIAIAIQRTHHIRLIQLTDEAIAESIQLAVYQTDGPNEGIYLADNDALMRIITDYSPSICQRDIDAVLTRLRLYSPVVKRSRERDLIAVNNGVFDFRAKKLLPFSPDLVFLTKSKVNYNPNPVNQVIYNPDDNTYWDVESWMNELSDDPEIVKLLWEILGAIIRPNVRWNKSAWFYSESGNNGKGTLCELMRNLCGAGSYASIPLSDFGKDFLLEPLMHANAVIVDENDVGAYVDKAGNLKAAITNDVIQINRKFKTPIAYQFFGFMVQCVNEMPRIKDKSDSFARRQLIVPFDKCFTGHERRYIKDDYLSRPVVLEYVLHKVLHMNNYTLSEPYACKNALEAYRENNDPVRQFVNEILPECVWDLLPFTFLFDLYGAWFKKNCPKGIPLGRNMFITDLLSAIDPTKWTCPGKSVQIRPKDMMNSYERLITEYDLKDWMTQSNNGYYPQLIPWPELKDHYTGLLRVTTTNTTDSNK